jgi:ApaG protein
MVHPAYLEHESNPDAFEYVFGYHVQVENHSNDTVKLIGRHWKITDAGGVVDEVRGEGVVGEQPVLRPTQAFQYSSFARLKTPSGIMAGAYEMQNTLTNKLFWIHIPTFSLDVPDRLTKVH